MTSASTPETSTPPSLPVQPAATSSWTPALALFALTLFVSAALLFLVQPMIGKLILPFFGGTPAVWITAMCFFQLLLLAGYLYADLLATRLDLRRQVAVHMGVILLPLLAFWLAPIGVTDGIAPSASVGPAVAVFLILFQLVGVPFFVVSATAPLLQKWFGCTDDPSARDPYFLYAASNAGSMLSLLAYPFVLEPNPHLGLRALGVVWMIGYGLLAVLIGGCAGLVIRGAKRQAAVVETATPTAGSPGAGAGPALPRDAVTAERPVERPVSFSLEEPTLGTRLRWVLLAFVPSSLMLGVTTYMTTDIAGVPLLWIIPLALYLLSFILVFSRTTARLQDVAVLLFPVVMLLVVFLMMTEVMQEQLLIRFVLHLGTLFVVAMVCHGELAKTRPATPFLTGYYFCLSLGGVLGGAFNGFWAPMLFDSVAEYPLALTLACLFLTPLGPSADESGQRHWSDWGLSLLIGGVGAYFLVLLMLRWSKIPPLAIHGWKSPVLFALLLGALAVVLAAYVRRGGRTEAIPRGLDIGLPLALGIAAFGMLVLDPFQGLDFAWLANRLPIQLTGQKMAVILTYVPLVALCYGLAGRPVRFALGVAALFAAASLSVNPATILYQERSYFGVNRVELRSGGIFGHYHALTHGTTVHGMQRSPQDPVLARAARSGAILLVASANPFEAAAATTAVRETLRDLRNEPMAYFHRQGPIGQLFAAVNLRPRPPRRIAILGLGAGTLVAYLRPGQHATIYEIDEVAQKIAEDERYFTYLKQTRGSYDIVLGDGRLKLAEAADGQFDMLFMDAFSSDSIPIHLVTREAIELYFRKLAPDGILVVNVANRYLNLAPVLANIGQNMDPPLVGLMQSDVDGVQQVENVDIMVSVLGEEETRQVVIGGGYVPGKFASSWVLLARQPEHFGLLATPWSGTQDEFRVQALAGLAGSRLVLPYLNAAFTRWEELKPQPDKGVWTDDYSNLVRILNR